MTAAEIAARLTKAQREALLSFPATASVKHSHERSHVACYHILDCKRLIEARWSPMPRERPWALTPLGLAVRELLKGNDDA